MFIVKGYSKAVNTYGDISCVHGVIDLADLHAAYCKESLFLIEPKDRGPGDIGLAIPRGHTARIANRFVDAVLMGMQYNGDAPDPFDSTLPWAKTFRAPFFRLYDDSWSSFKEIVTADAEGELFVATYQYHVGDDVGEDRVLIIGSERIESRIDSALGELSEDLTIYRPLLPELSYFYNPVKSYMAHESVA